MKTFLKSILTILVFISTLLPAQDGLIPIHRYFSKEDKDHFYTKKTDVKKKWKSQGIEFYAYANPVEGTVPIYRYYDKDDKDHFYTKKADVKKKWKSQGVEFYAFESAGLEKPALVSEEKPAVTTEAKPEVKVASREESGFPLIAGEGEKKVITSGYGKNPDEALTQALRNAVEEAVGTYMTSTTRIENDELIEDKVLSLSRGFIKDFKKLAEMKVEDEIKVTVSAIVTETQILETLKASGVEIKVEGQKMFQQFVSFDRQMEDEYRVVSNLLKELPKEPPLDYSVEMMGQPVRDGDLDKWESAYIKVRIVGKVNDNYRNQYQNLRNILQETAFENKIFYTNSEMSFKIKNDYKRTLTDSEYENYNNIYGSGMIKKSGDTYYDIFSKPYSPYLIGLWLKHNSMNHAGNYHLYKFLNKKTHNSISRFISDYFYDINFNIILKSEENYKIGFKASTSGLRITNNNENEVMVVEGRTRLDSRLSRKRDKKGREKKRNGIEKVNIDRNNFRYFNLSKPRFDPWENQVHIWGNDKYSEGSIITSDVSITYYQVSILPSPNTYIKRTWENEWDSDVLFKHELTLQLSKTVLKNLVAIEIMPLPVTIGYKDVVEQAKRMKNNHGITIEDWFFNMTSAQQREHIKKYGEPVF